MQGKVKRLERGGFKDSAYWDIGQGFPILLVHGFPADHSLWKNQVASLQKEYRLLLPDIPGTGQSPIKQDISIEDIADFLENILQQEQIQKCILIGHSMGGYAALAFADKYPHYLKGWGLFHSSALADDKEKIKGRKRSIRMMEHYGQEKFIRQMLPSLFSKKFKKEHTEVVQDLIHKRIAAGIDALIPYYHAMRERPERTQTLENTEVPVLFIIGQEDTAAPMNKVIQQVYLPSVSQVNIFKNVGHLGMLERPELSTKVLNHFFKFCQSI